MHGDWPCARRRVCPWMEARNFRERKDETAEETTFVENNGQRAADNRQQTTGNGQRKEFGKTRGPCLSTRLARFPPTEPGNSNRGAAVTLQWWIDASIHRRREDGDIR
jgi:hypothetical protein